MSEIREILRAQPSELWTIEPDASVYAALELMAEKDVGALIVVRDGRVEGVFSERDYARRVILVGKSSKTALVSELMSTPVLYVRPDQSVEQAMALMSDKRVRHLPVLEGERLIGIVTIGDLVRHIIAEQDFTIDQLENYIRGGP